VHQNVPRCLPICEYPRREHPQGELHEVQRGEPKRQSRCHCYQPSRGEHNIPASRGVVSPLSTAHCTRPHLAVLNPLIFGSGPRVIVLCALCISSLRQPLAFLFLLHHSFAQLRVAGLFQIALFLRLPPPSALSPTLEQVYTFLKHVIVFSIRIGYNLNATQEFALIEGYVQFAKGHPKGPACGSGVGTPMAWCPEGITTVGKI